MTGHSVATWKGEDIPFVTADFSKVKTEKYQSHPDAKCKVTGMWVAYHDAYHAYIPVCDGLDAGAYHSFANRHIHLSFGDVPCKA